MSLFPRFLLLAMTTMVIGATIFTGGCGDSGHAQLRVVHASPDAPNVDVLVDGKTVLTNVAYETASNYLTVGAGSRKIEVRATGTSQDVISATVSLSRNNHYTVLAVDKLANITPLVLTDDNTPPASGQIKLRLVHASPTAGPVDIYVEAPGAGVTGSPTLTNVAFKTASSYLAVPAGSYEVYITPTGTKTVALDSGSLSLSAGQIRTAVALDAPGGGTPLTAIVLKDLN
jgi:Domain of unknown function (DUF4397)